MHFSVAGKGKMSMLRKPLVVLSNAAAGFKGLSWDLAVLGVVANIIRLIIPQNGVDNIRQFLCDMPNGIHIWLPFGSFLRHEFFHHGIVVDGNGGCLPERSAQIGGATLRHVVSCSGEFS